MTDSRVAVAADRLPWLSDEPRPGRKAGGRRVLGAVAAALAIVLVAAAAYLLGQRSAGQSPAPVAPLPQSAPTTTVPLPQPRVAQPMQPEIDSQPMPEVELRPAPPMPRTEPQRQPRPERVVVAEPAPAEAEAGEEKTAETDPAPEELSAEAKPAPKSNEHPDRPWPVRVVPGASGRLVRVGAFTAPRQAKKAWWAMVRNNPALKRLPALVVPAPSRRDGRTYYRLQMGTTSQAHSEVLCQRMRRIGQSCVVIEVYNRGEGAAE